VPVYQSMEIATSSDEEERPFVRLSLHKLFQMNHPKTNITVITSSSLLLSEIHALSGSSEVKFSTEASFPREFDTATSTTQALSNPVHITCKAPSTFSSRPDPRPGRGTRIPASVPQMSENRFPRRGSCWGFPREKFLRRPAKRKKKRNKQLNYCSWRIGLHDPQSGVKNLGKVGVT
jgi:hypothetical protein